MTPRALSAAILTTLVAVVPLTHQAFIPAARVIDQPLDDTVVDVPVMTELTHPITLQDALSFISTARLSSEVEGFRFESDTVVGEYWMTDNLSPEAFLRAFDEDTGTAPQVVGLLSLESVRLSEAVDVKAPGTIAVAAEEYLAPAAKMPVDVVATLSDSAPRSESLQSMASGSTWTPRDAHIRVEESSVWANVVEIKQTYQWFGLNPFNAPHVIPDHWGAEFGVDLTTELPQYQVGSRPNCWPGYEEAPAARNDNFTFWVMVTDGTEYLGNPGPAGFYGDYFDALDSCARNSITVGAADPGAIPSDPYGTQWISITILADRGNDEVSRVSGNVQALERYSCEASPSTPLTVCMGLDTDLPWPGPGAQSQLTKNETTVWYAPDRCWYTPEFGSAAYDMGCEGGPGHGR